ncbi:replicative DNA helicase [Exiguobacterium flavidum]|uniref:replicative DNA helicase n=1 Tax=Exiguobacterium flavidum TaxID=2184695 RepID=UPI000DF7532E|nr:replicative DNA helicase [Exiguobacterium flavidum]
MEAKELTGITSGYKERMRRVALFDPLFELGRKQMRDDRGETIDMKGLGMLTLLYFFEQKVMRNNKVGAKDAAVFLRTATNDAYAVPVTHWDEIASVIIKTFRPQTGKKREYRFEDWETGRTGEIEYAILKANGYDAKENVQYYTLDEDGLELVFATKEFYSEFQLSINQLMLRKQLEKGEFQSALRQINEMFVDVEALEERISKLRHEIQRSIVSEETFERYSQLIEDVHARLERENEEFKELREFVTDSRERLYEKDAHRREPKTYGLILTIVQRLEQVHYSHSDLLRQIIELKTQTLRAAQEALYHTGIDAFNFNQEIVYRIVGTPLDPDTMKGMLHPFLSIQRAASWSPFAVFAEQNIRENREASDDFDFMKVEGEARDGDQKRLKEAYGEMMEKLLEAIEGGERTLSGFVETIRISGKEELLQQRYFYDFWMILHQRSPLQAEDAKGEENDRHLFDRALASLGDRTLIVQEQKIILHVTSRYSIQEMEFEIKEEMIDAIQ